MWVVFARKVLFQSFFCRGVVKQRKWTGKLGVLCRCICEGCRTSFHRCRKSSRVVQNVNQRATCEFEGQAVFRHRKLTCSSASRTLKTHWQCMHMAGNCTHIKYMVALVASTVFKQKRFSGCTRPKQILWSRIGQIIFSKTRLISLSFPFSFRSPLPIDKNKNNKNKMCGGWQTNFSKNNGYCSGVG